jgi:hypothetical protein
LVLVPLYFKIGRRPVMLLSIVIVCLPLSNGISTKTNLTDQIISTQLA